MAFEYVVILVATADEIEQVVAICHMQKDFVRDIERHCAQCAHEMRWMKGVDIRGGTYSSMR